MMFLEELSISWSVYIFLTEEGGHFISFRELFLHLHLMTILEQLGFKEVYRMIFPKNEKAWTKHINYVKFIFIFFLILYDITVLGCPPRDQQFLRSETNARGH